MDVDWVRVILQTTVSTVTGGLVGAIVGALVAKPKQMKKQAQQERERQNNRDFGIMALLKSSMTRSYQYYKMKGSMTPTEREELDTMHSAYKALGGNHYIDDLYERARNLPVKYEGIGKEDDKYE